VTLSTGRWAKNRASWSILDNEIFFESDVPLNGRAEAVGTAVFLQAMRNNLNVSVEDEVCKEWTDNLERVMPLANKWWGLSPVSVDARTVPCASRPGDCGAFFTAGVDSFYTMLRGGGQISTLVFVIGFDIGLEDTKRLDKARAWIREVAEKKGLKVVEVATNLKAHPFFRTLRWGDHTHGAALAAVGHTLDGHLSELRIASTDASGRPRGSNPELDHLWSSGRLSIKYDSPGVSRIDKVKYIVSEPLVRRYLRVCWENRNDELNCGICEKCVRTQAQLWAVDPTYFLDQSCFPPGDVPKKVNGLASVPIHIFNQWRDIYDVTEDSELKGAINRLFKRSRRADRIMGYKKAMKWYAGKLRQMLRM
jgi:hypothetical protein